MVAGYRPSIRVVSTRSRTSALNRFGKFAAEHYISAMFFICTFSPLLRRLVDYESGYHSLSPIALLPMVSFLPGCYVVWKRWSQLSSGYRAVVAIWCVAFGFSYAVAFASGSIIPAAFTLVQFVAPLGIAGILLMASGDYRVAYHRGARAFLYCACAASLYAIYQYVSPPPWDVAWVQNANIVSIGDPVPFGLRVFGPYNSDGPFASFIALALIVNFPRLSLKRWLLTLMYAPCIIALLLTEVRSAWVGVAFGTVLYLVLAPSRRGPMLSLASLFVTSLLLGGVVLSSVRNSQMAVESVSTRLSTFQTLSGDSSVTTRQAETTEAWAQGAKDPLGLGLGAASAATKINGGTGGGIDNGYLSRLVEMGIIGWIAYLVALAVALIVCLVAYAELRRSGDILARNLAALAVSLQLLLLLQEAAFDQHVAFTGLFFWYSLFLAGAAVTAAAVSRGDRNTYAVSRHGLPAVALTSSSS